MPDTQQPARYSAFLSYSHLDRAWGEWLQTALESYAIPRDLRGRLTAGGPIPATLRPVFRDRWDLAAGHSLTEQIVEALEQSRHLIVLCSPHSAASPYVDSEIRHFKARGRQRNILAVIVGGRPGDPALECFPAALRYDQTDDGGLVPAVHEPLAADARPEGDDKELAQLKIVAGMLGVPLDEIRKREEIERRSRVRKARLIAASMAGLALLASGSAYVAMNARAVADEQRQEAVRRYDQALDSTLRFVTTSATFRAMLDRRIAGGNAAAADFDIAKLDTKGANEDFQKFLRDRDSRDVWLRLVRVLISYEKAAPTELRAYRDELKSTCMPVKWLHHAQTITRNLIGRSDANPAYRETQAVIETEMVRLRQELPAGCFAAVDAAAARARDCAVVRAPGPQAPNMPVVADRQFNQMAQGAPPMQGTDCR